MARTRTFAREVPGKREMQVRIDMLKADVIAWKKRLGLTVERGYEDIRSRDLILLELLWLLQLWPVKAILFLLHPWIVKRRHIRPLLLVRKTQEQVEGSVKAGYAFWNEFRLKQATEKAQARREEEKAKLFPERYSIPGEQIVEALRGPSVAPSLFQDGEEVLHADPKESGDPEASLSTARPPTKDVG